ncbi:MAG TPA: Lrp/AsnC family transcriptional regulator [Thermoplasmatales archaeon]|nr:Lrp/AsnC family transcriptional regulator [Thermoplasmatales archaeon]
MAIGFALISVSPMKEREVFDRVSSIDEVKEIYPLFGEYDILAKIESGDFDEVGAVVIKKIRAIPGVIDTKTLLTSESLKGK